MSDGPLNCCSIRRGMYVMLFTVRAVTAPIQSAPPSAARSLRRAMVLLCATRLVHSLLLAYNHPQLKGNDCMPALQPTACCGQKSTGWMVNGVKVSNHCVVSFIVKLQPIPLLNNKLYGLSCSGGHHLLLFYQRFQKIASRS